MVQRFCLSGSGRLRHSGLWEYPICVSFPSIWPADQAGALECGVDRIDCCEPSLRHCELRLQQPPQWCHSHRKRLSSARASLSVLSGLCRLCQSHPSDAVHMVFHRPPRLCSAVLRPLIATVDSALSSGHQCSHSLPLSLRTALCSSLSPPSRSSRICFESRNRG